MRHWSRPSSSLVVALAKSPVVRFTAQFPKAERPVAVWIAVVLAAATTATSRHNFRDDFASATASQSIWYSVQF